MADLGHLLAECPIHGKIQFERSEPMNWWECPKWDRNLGDNFCSSVILDEHLTPDGADVINFDEYSGLNLIREMFPNE